MKQYLFIISGILTLFGLMLGGAAIENVNFDDLFNTYTIRAAIGYTMFMTGSGLAFYGSITHR